jgi:hypothetical protein
LVINDIELLFSINMADDLEVVATRIGLAVKTGDRLLWAVRDD